MNSVATDTEAYHALQHGEPCGHEGCGRNADDWWMLNEQYVFRCEDHAPCPDCFRLDCPDAGEGGCLPHDTE